LIKKPLATSAVASGAAQTQEADAQPLYTGRLDSFRNKTLEQKIQELADREEIRDLIAIYAHRVAHGLANADLFTDDGAYINRRALDSPGTVVRGRKELDAHFIARPGGAGTAMPMIHNSIIAIHKDEASAICSIELRVSDSGTSTIASGYYQDRLRREDGHWKFVVRDVTFFHWVPLQQGWATPQPET
jgi:SnoaL-like domain